MHTKQSTCLGVTFTQQHFFMKQLLIAVLTVGILSPALVSCKKKKSGVCYCSYLSGDKKEFDMSHMDRSAQITAAHK